MLPDQPVALPRVQHHRNQVQVEPRHDGLQGGNLEHAGELILTNPGQEVHGIVIGHSAGPPYHDRVAPG
ncbi:hypothetical protein D1872_305160 [compost metagenome]